MLKEVSRPLRDEETVAPGSLAKQGVKEVGKFKHRLSILIPTRDRPEDLRRLLASINGQTVLPERVIVVASGTAASREATSGFPRLNIQYIHVNQAGTSWQRNVGIRSLDPGCTLVGFFDDDVVLEPDALEKMLAFWETAPPEVGGAGFNFNNVLDLITQRKWSLNSLVRLYEKLVIRNEPRGRVLPSGLPTPIFPTSETVRVDWLETLALTLRREVVEEFAFDDFFAGYSYLEHVEYTYRVSRRYKLFAVSNARVTHYSRPIRNGYALGKMQVVNRIHFVRKHKELSSPQCCLALLLHMFFNVAVGVLLRDAGYLKRACGNCVGLAQVAGGRMAPVAGDVR